MPTTPARRAFTYVLPLALLLAAGTQFGCQKSLLAVRQSGDANFARGQYTEAEADYREYLDRSPARPEVHYMLGRTLLAQGRTAEAREQLLLAYRLTPENDEVFVQTCEGLFADKQYEELNRLLRSRTIDRGRMSDWTLLADFSMRQGDKDEAARSLLAAARVDGGTSVEPQLGLAKVYMAAGDTTRAIERLRMAYYVAPQNGEVAALASQLGQIVGPSFGVPPTERMMQIVPVADVPTDRR
ncbi:MAG: tetratricopeptide repeat protein [Phycisphaeraceae bacterium]|nr:tetratricopeptide repeat protein [Phycisphaeraceae bacterium]MBX3405869.1 tetratricopeptide repeat protein [Phycisphaeraceae bacterium]